MSKRKSIFRKTLLSLLVLLLLIVIIIHLSIFFIYNGMYLEKKNRELHTQMKTLTDLLENVDGDSVNDLLKKYAKNNNVNIALTTSSGTRYFQGDTLMIKAGDTTASKTLKLGNIKDTNAVKFLSKSIKSAELGKINVQLGANLQALKESRSIALSLLPFSLLISFIASFVFAYLYSRKMTAPLNSIITSVQEMTELNPHTAINIRNEDEIGELAGNLNTLYKEFLSVIDDYETKVDELHDAERERLAFYRATSHELKTPLAKLSVMTENAMYGIGTYRDRNRYMKDTMSIIRDMSEMIQDMLEGLKFQCEVRTVSVRQTIHEVVDEYAILAKAKGLYLQVVDDQDFTMQIPQKELKKVLSNLLSNAIKYSTGEIRISLTERNLFVYNSAEAIDEKRFRAIFRDPLEGDSATNSSGFGLYIVGTILDNYQIPYRFEAYDKGYRFIIEPM